VKYALEDRILICNMVNEVVGTYGDIIYGMSSNTVNKNELFEIRRAKELITQRRILSAIW